MILLMTVILLPKRFLVEKGIIKGQQKEFT